MEKIYLLLRNNQQSGPYSLEEILQAGLKPFDLVWVQGKSAAWQYPAEVPSLQPHVSATPQPESPYQPISTSLMESGTLGASKNVFVSMPHKERTFNVQSPAERSNAGMASNEQPSYRDNPVVDNEPERQHSVKMENDRAAMKASGSYDYFRNQNKKPSNNF